MICSAKKLAGFLPSISEMANSRVRDKFTHPAMLQVRGNKRA
jgi:hypothetical protein